MTFERFMEIALYDPTFGYYRQPRKRVGYAPETDFFTASTSGEVFGELIASAAIKLLGEATPADYTFVEIGTETAGGILADVSHPFKEVRTIPLGAPFEISGLSIVFSNELFDAQPCRRFIRRSGQWHELGVTSSLDGLQEVPLPHTAQDGFLPEDAPEGYQLDAPRAASALLDTITRQSWQGLFIACDYGKTWHEISSSTPNGTTRAYFRHSQSNDLLARPGEQDLTCHVCWDWLSEGLNIQNFDAVTLESQEAFLIHNAGEKIAEISSQEASRLSKRKLALMQLLHPAHLGQKFQVLHARRDHASKDS